jgi:hypothetical protein
MVEARSSVEGLVLIWQTLNTTPCMHISIGMYSRGSATVTSMFIQSEGASTRPRRAPGRIQNDLQKQVSLAAPPSGHPPGLPLSGPGGLLSLLDNHRAGAAWHTSRCARRSGGGGGGGGGPRVQRGARRLAHLHQAPLEHAHAARAQTATPRGVHRPQAARAALWHATRAQGGRDAHGGVRMPGCASCERQHAQGAGRSAGAPRRRRPPREAAAARPPSPPAAAAAGRGKGGALPRQGAGSAQWAGRPVPP